MKKKNGFTLVELLAVIVVLALIMIIAIPSVLKVMNNARRQSFALYIEKVVTAVQTQYVYDAATGDIPGAGVYIYDIQEDLDLTSTGSYEGYVLVDATNVDTPEYVIYMHDNNYMISTYNITRSKMPTADSDAIEDYKNGSEGYLNNYGNSYKVCEKYTEGRDDVTSCKTREGYVISEE